MEYPFNSSEIISTAESNIAKPLTDSQKEMIDVNIKIINEIIVPKTKPRAQYIPLLNFNIPRHCKYPNIYAEYKATMVHICTLSEYAGITSQLMEKVLNDNASLSYTELTNIWHLFMDLDHYKCVLDYIWSPKLSFVNPEKNKTQCRIKLLNDAMNKIKTLTNEKSIDEYDRERISRCQEVINQMRLKKAVPFAFYRYALNEANNMIGCLTPKKLRNDYFNYEKEGKQNNDVYHIGNN